MSSPAGEALSGALRNCRVSPPSKESIPKIVRKVSEKFEGGIFERDAAVGVGVGAGRIVADAECVDDRVFGVGDRPVGKPLAGVSLLDGIVALHVRDELREGIVVRFQKHRLATRRFADECPIEVLMWTRVAVRHDLVTVDEHVRADSLLLDEGARGDGFVDGHGHGGGVGSSLHRLRRCTVKLSVHAGKTGRRGCR